MDIISIIGLSLALSMDAFAVALAVGASLMTVTRRQTFRVAFHFGLFQAFMPIIGWGLGLAAADWIRDYDHWVAFGLLGILGGNMIHGYFQLEEAEKAKPGDPTRGISLIAFSVATSIDALAVGLSLAVLNVSIWFPSLVIGVITAVVSGMGLHLGRHAGVHVGPRMEVAGGGVLILIGARILFEHLSA